MKTLIEKIEEHRVARELANTPKAKAAAKAEALAKADTYRPAVMTPTIKTRINTAVFN